MARSQQSHRNTAGAGYGRRFAFKDCLIVNPLVREEIRLHLGIGRKCTNRCIRGPPAVVDQLHGGKLEPVWSKNLYEHGIPHVDRHASVRFWSFAVLR